jgi:hypothetical protein
MALGRKCGDWIRGELRRSSRIAERRESDGGVSVIAEAAIAGATVCFVACLRFSKFVIERSDPFSEKRRILERRFANHESNELYTTGTEPTKHHISHATRKRETEVDLIALADEEKNWKLSR